MRASPMRAASRSTTWARTAKVCRCAGELLTSSADTTTQDGTSADRHHTAPADSCCYADVEGAAADWRHIHSTQQLGCRHHLHAVPRLYSLVQMCKWANRSSHPPRQPQDLKSYGRLCCDKTCFALDLPSLLMSGAVATGDG